MRALAYIGPTARLEDMLYSSKVEDIPGLNIMIGESSLGYGLAMYLAVDDDIDVCHVPKGSRICEYGAGRFVGEEMSKGDKTVCFFFDTVNAFVFYEGVATSLVDCMLDALGEESATTDTFTNILEGHLLSSSDDVIKITPDPLYTKRFYIPTTITDVQEGMRIDSLGVYANDLAYEKGVTTNEEEYLNASEGTNGMNVLALMWRLVKSRSDESESRGNFVSTDQKVEPMRVKRRWARARRRRS